MHRDKHESKEQDEDEDVKENDNQNNFDDNYSDTSGDYTLFDSDSKSFGSWVMLEIVGCGFYVLKFFIIC